jgi:hypothetical protein
MRLRAVLPIAVILIVLTLVAWGFLDEELLPVQGSAGSGTPPSTASGSSPSLPFLGTLPSAAPRPTATPVPVVLRGQVVAGDTGEPLAGARVAAVAEGLDGDRAAATTDAGGAFTVTAPGQPTALQVTAAGFAPRRVPASAGELSPIALSPSVAQGTVQDAFNRRPIGGATLRAGALETRTRPEGSFYLADLADGAAARVTAPPYEPATIRPQRAPQTVQLRPREVRGVYLSFFGVGNRELRDTVLGLIERTEVNAVVVDVKGDRGWIAYRSAVPLAEEIGANRHTTLADPAAFLEAVHRRGGLAIARIVVFKDHPLAQARPEWAVRDARTGRPWIDLEDLSWTDPFREEVWDYIIALAVEAAKLGFDEIQYDYVRFPTDAGAGTTVDRATFSQPNTEAGRVAAIAGLLRKTRAALQPYPVRLSIDVFGYTTWREDDMGIGQHIERLAPHIDVLAPMVYPSTYSDGLPVDGQTYRPAARYPYEIVNLSTKRAVERLRPFGTEVRPWLQYFNDYSGTDMRYTAQEIEIQKRAARDAGGRGWMFWDPTNEYVKGGFGPRE